MKTCLFCKKIIHKEPVYGLHGRCFAQWFSVDGIEQFYDIDPKKLASYSNEPITKQNNSFFHGNYLKYSASLDQTDYILKVQEDKFPELPLVEFLCNELAEVLGIEVPSYYLIDFNGKTTFVTRNFMQDYVGTLNHIYKYLPKGENYYNCEEIIKVIGAQTGKASEIEKFIEICLFDSLIGNNDRHGRNLGLIVAGQTTILAPMYDNPSCIGIEEEFFLQADMSPSGAIWTSTSKEPKVKDYIDDFRRLGYGNIVNQMFIKIASKKNILREKIKNSIMSETRKTAIEKLVFKRIGDFENA